MWTLHIVINPIWYVLVHHILCIQIDTIYIGGTKSHEIFDVYEKIKFKFFAKVDNKVEIIKGEFKFELLNHVVTACSIRLSELKGKQVQMKSYKHDITEGSDTDSWIHVFR